MVAKEEVSVEFPPYCIMDGRKMALIKITGMEGIGNSDGCVGCGVYTCFGNKSYKLPKTDYQKKQIDEWISYIYSKDK